MDQSFNVELARMYGVFEAILIQHIDCWLTSHAKFRNVDYFHQGNYWVDLTIADLHKSLPFCSEDQIKRTLKRLKAKHVIRSQHLNPDRMKRENWYTFTTTFLESPAKACIQYPWQVICEPQQERIAGG